MLSVFGHVIYVTPSALNDKWSVNSLYAHASGLNTSKLWCCHLYDARGRYKKTLRTQNGIVCRFQMKVTENLHEMKRRAPD